MHGRLLKPHKRQDVPLAGSTLMMDSSAKTFEQQPPKISDSMAPMASHCGMVSMNTRPARAMARLKTGRLSSMPYISAFSSDGAALMTRGDGAGMAYVLSPRSLLLGGACLCSAGRRRVVMAKGDSVAQVLSRFLVATGTYKNCLETKKVPTAAGRAKREVPSLAAGTEKQGRARFSGATESQKDGQVRCGRCPRCGIGRADCLVLAGAWTA